MSMTPTLKDGHYGYQESLSFNKFESPNQVSWLQDQITQYKETPKRFVIEIKHMNYRKELTKSSVHKELSLISLFFLLVSRMDKDFGASREMAVDNHYFDPEACFALYREWVGDQMPATILGVGNFAKCLPGMLKISNEAKKANLPEDWQTVYKNKFKKEFPKTDIEKLVRILFQAHLGLYFIPKRKNDEDQQIMYDIGGMYSDAIDKILVPAAVKKAINFVDINRERVFEDEFMDDYYWALSECFPNTYKALKRIGIKEMEIADKMKSDEAKKVFKILQARKHLELKEIQYTDAKQGNSVTAKFLLKNMDDEMLRKKVLKGTTEDDDVPTEEDSLPDYLKDTIPESPVKLETNLKGIHADLGLDRD